VFEGRNSNKFRRRSEVGRPDVLIPSKESANVRQT
jgi:hypothetical protein